MPADSRSKNGVASLAYVAGIHVAKLRRNKDVEGRGEPGHNGSHELASNVVGYDPAASAFSICGLSTAAKLSGVIGPTSL